jgi:hypothetical protein
MDLRDGMDLWDGMAVQSGVDARGGQAWGRVGSVGGGLRARWHNPSEWLNSSGVRRSLPRHRSYTRQCSAARAANDGANRGA